ncbi:MAG: hypothetical protein KJ624_03450 [Chloroflexi bacterium]|nr:hypothetical protein [Chloroflexota bacterium]
MVTAYAKDESLATFVEKAKVENQEELDQLSELQRMLEELRREAERPQIYQISVRSNW